MSSEKRKKMNERRSDERKKWNQKTKTQEKDTIID
jgi:hypothetical protein